MCFVCLKLERNIEICAHNLPPLPAPAILLPCMHDRHLARQSLRNSGQISCPNQCMTDHDRYLAPIPQTMLSGTDTTLYLVPSASQVWVQQLHAVHTAVEYLVLKLGDCCTTLSAVFVPSNPQKHHQNEDRLRACETPPNDVIESCRKTTKTISNRVHT